MGEVSEKEAVSNQDPSTAPAPHRFLLQKGAKGEYEASTAAGTCMAPGCQ